MRRGLVRALRARARTEPGPGAATRPADRVPPPSEAPYSPGPWSPRRDRHRAPGLPGHPHRGHGRRRRLVDSLNTQLASSRTMEENTNLTTLAGGGGRYTAPSSMTFVNAVSRIRGTCWPGGLPAVSEGITISASNSATANPTLSRPSTGRSISRSNAQSPGTVSFCQSASGSRHHPPAAPSRLPGTVAAADPPSHRREAAGPAAICPSRRGSSATTTPTIVSGRRIYMAASSAPRPTPSAPDHR